jgi:hypothetical protein
MPIKYERPLRELVNIVKDEDPDRPRTGFLIGEREEAEKTYKTIVTIRDMYVPQQNSSGRVTGEAIVHGALNASRGYMLPAREAGQDIHDWQPSDFVGVMFYRGSGHADVKDVHGYVLAIAEECKLNLAMIIVDREGNEKWINERVEPVDDQ